MKIKDMIENAEMVEFPCISHFEHGMAKQFGIYEGLSDDPNNRWMVKELFYSYENHHAGYAHYLDDVLMAVSSYYGENSKTLFEWVHMLNYVQFHAYLLEHFVPSDCDYSHITIVDLQEDVNISWK